MCKGNRDFYRNTDFISARNDNADKAALEDYVRTKWHLKHRRYRNLKVIYVRVGRLYKSSKSEGHIFIIWRKLRVSLISHIAE